MTMSSYLINSNYTESSFPPCEEYEDNGYISVSSDYYERPKESGFSHHEETTFPRANYQDQSYDYGNGSTNGLVDYNDRLHTQPRSIPQNHGPHLGTEGCTTMANKDSSHATEAHFDSQKGKELIVYPWMKKVNVNLGKYVTVCKTLIIHLKVFVTTHKMTPSSMFDPYLNDLLPWTRCLSN